MEVYHYKLFKANWFISIKIFAEILEKVEKVESEEYQEICDGLWIKYPKKVPGINSLTNADKKAAQRGLTLVSNEILQCSKYGGKTVIYILDIAYDLLYFQDEGLVVAIIYWAAQAFGFKTKEIEEEYDREKKQYIFKYNGEYL